MSPESAPAAPIKVLHVTGSGRSGSTLLTSTLGSVPSVFAAGEIRFLWERALVDGEPCGCGRAPHDCPVWGPILARLGPVTEPAAADDVRRRLGAFARYRHAWRFLRRRPFTADEQAVADQLTAVYRAIAAETGASVIVDSSKLPLYAAILDRDPAIELSVLHLVRDPRAAAFSWGRGRATDSSEEMDRFSPVKSALLWNAANGMTALLWRGRGARALRIRYEDVMASPRSSLERIARFAGIDPDALPFVDDDQVVLQDGHVLAGNPNRRNTGPVRFRTDRRWETGLSRRDRWTVTALTSPLLRRMGYRWSAR